MLCMCAPSASRMVQKLAELGYLDYERHGIIRPTALANRSGLSSAAAPDGGRLRTIGDGKCLEETEKVEHSISGQTLRCLQDLLAFQPG